MIEIENVTRNYGRKIAVSRLNLKVEPGEVFAFLGPNGAGKTTTIKMLVGLLQPNEGRIQVCGHDVVTEHRQANLRLGYVPDQPYLYDKLTGRETLHFIGEMYGLPAAQVADNVARQIEQFELADFIDQLTENYSHGMKQRVVFATALVHQPTVLIVDEPMVGLDPRSMRLVKDLLCNQAAAGVSIFMSTHTLSVAEEIADRIGVIESGNLRFLGTVENLRDQLALHGTTLEHLYLQLTSDNGKPNDKKRSETLEVNL